MVAIIASSFYIHYNLPTQPLPLVIPKNWPKPNKDYFKNNPITQQGFELGKKLFYDGRLSKDGNISCASCHQQFAAFSTYDHDFSHGFNNSFTTRNAPTLVNLAWMNDFHWDGAINHLEVQPLAPISAQNEMAETLQNVLKKINADATYKKMFDAAFGKGPINSKKMLRALAQFSGSIISSNSKYDKVKNGTAQFTESEQAGYAFFIANCNSCHTEPLFTSNGYSNNGLPINERLKDFGKMSITGLAIDSLKFKIPTLRNITLTAPYMHDGRFSTLGQVFEHYKTGLADKKGIDTSLNKNISISGRQKLDLLAFLHTLKDEDLLTNKRFAAPN
jgi:cytochrome c peroxidase